LDDQLSGIQLSDEHGRWRSCTAPDAVSGGELFTQAITIILAAGVRYCTVRLVVHAFKSPSEKSVR
jgi:hypothetical protein